MTNLQEKYVNCVTPNINRKDKIASKILLIVRKEHLDYEELRYIFRRVRKNAGIRRPKTSRALPHVLSESDLKTFFRTIQECGNIEHQIMLKFLFFTSIRVSELCNIKASQVDLANCKVFIEQGKGAKDRYILFPEAFQLTLASHMAAHPRNTYLFESRLFNCYTTRRIQQIVEEYREKSGIEQPISPHSFRHQMLTWLTRSGLTDAQIQLISGHASKKSLEVYQHISLSDVSQDYQTAVRAVAI